MPKADARTAEQIRAELAVERQALKKALGEAQTELKRSARLASAAPLALAAVTFLARRLLARWRR